MFLNSTVSSMPPDFYRCAKSKEEDDPIMRNSGGRSTRSQSGISCVRIENLNNLSNKANGQSQTNNLSNNNNPSNAWKNTARTEKLRSNNREVGNLCNMRLG